jgi:hypothetical protein
MEEEALRALELLVGQWAMEIKGPDGQPWPGKAHASFQWLPSRAHLVQRTVTGTPGAPDSTSIIGCDSTSGRYVQLYSDERGVSRIYDMTFGGRQWVLERDGDPFPQRFVGEISADGSTIDGRWEKAENRTDFSVDFSLTYRRLPPSSD